MSCGYGTAGFQCDQAYTLNGAVSQTRANLVHALGKQLGLQEFNPTSVRARFPQRFPRPTPTHAHGPACARSRLCR